MPLLGCDATALGWYWSIAKPRIGIDPTLYSTSISQYSGSGNATRKTVVERVILSYSFSTLALVKFFSVSFAYSVCRFFFLVLKWHPERILSTLFYFAKIGNSVEGTVQSNNKRKYIFFIQIFNNLGIFEFRVRKNFYVNRQVYKQLFYLKYNIYIYIYIYIWLFGNKFRFFQETMKVDLFIFEIRSIRLYTRHEN